MIEFGPVVFEEKMFEDVNGRWTKSDSKSSAYAQVS
jgi:hypothetical protein